MVWFPEFVYLGVDAEFRQIGRIDGRKTTFQHTMTDWSDFYVAVAGASAALKGLIFVGVSISLPKILSIRGLPDRALLSLVLLLNVLVLSLLFLVPHLTGMACGLDSGWELV